MLSSICAYIEEELQLQEIWIDRWAGEWTLIYPGDFVGRGKNIVGILTLLGVFSSTRTLYKY